MCFLFGKITLHCGRLGEEIKCMRRGRHSLGYVTNMDPG